MHTCQRVDCFIQMKSSSNTPRGPQLEENGKARGPRPICQKKKKEITDEHHQHYDAIITKRLW